MKKQALRHAAAARPSQESKNPYVFVVGCPRSGTTLLQRMLDNHPQLAVANDTHFIPRSLIKAEPLRVADGIAGRKVPLTAKLVTSVRDYKRFTRLGLDEDAITEAATESADYAAFVGALYTRFARSRGKSLGGEKTPDYVKRLPLLHGLFPNVRTIHIIRDGRDVALSVRDWSDGRRGPGKMELWQTEPIGLCALWWRWQVGTGRQSGATLGRRKYYEVQYADLVAEPERELKQLSEFLDLPFSEDMQHYYRGKVKAKPGLSAKSAWLPPTPGLRDWRSQMHPRDLELFEAIAGDLLDELGFERSVRRISPKIVRVGKDCSAWWEDMLARRVAKLRRRLDRQAAGA